MFDYMVKILPNGRVMVREVATKKNNIMQPGEISTFFNEKLIEQLADQEESEKKAENIKRGALGGGDEEV